MKIEIYTDGACSGNPGRGGIGAVILTDKSDKPAGTICMGYRLTTNNRMEIMAVIEALEQVRANNPAETLAGSEIIVYTDSQIVYGTMAMGWKAKANTDLWARLYRRMAMLRAEKVSIRFEKVKGHAGNRWNEEADKLAVAGTKDPGAVRDEGYSKESDGATLSFGRANSADFISESKVREWLSENREIAYRTLASLFAERELSLERFAAEITKRLQ